MIYTVIDGTSKQTFEGISRVIKSKRPQHANYLGMVYVEGEIDIWWLANGTVAVEELQRYYRMESGIDVEVKLFEPVN